MLVIFFFFFWITQTNSKGPVPSADVLFEGTTLSTDITLLPPSSIQNPIYISDNCVQSIKTYSHTCLSFGEWQGEKLCYKNRLFFLSLPFL